MGLTLGISSFFVPSVRNRGESYFAEGRVQIVRGSASEAHAVVRGTEEYEVRLALRGSNIVAYCECPYAQNDFCKHMWAVICASDREGHLIAVGQSRARITLSPVDGADQDLDDDRVLLAVAGAANDTSLDSSRPAPGAAKLARHRGAPSRDR